MLPLLHTFSELPKHCKNIQHFASFPVGLPSEKLAQNSPAQDTGTFVNRPRQCWCLLLVVKLVRGRWRGAVCTSDRADGRHTTELLSRWAPELHQPPAAGLGSVCGEWVSLLLLCYGIHCSVHRSSLWSFSRVHFLYISALYILALFCSFCLEMASLNLFTRVDVSNLKLSQYPTLCFSEATTYYSLSFCKENIQRFTF